MLIVALVLAVIGLAALVTAVVTGNEMVAWVCIAASVVGVLLLIVDAVRERQQTAAGSDGDDAEDSAETTYENFDADYPGDDYPDDADADDTDAAPTSVVAAKSDADSSVDDKSEGPTGKVT